MLNNPEVEGKSKKIYKLDDNTYFMCFKPHLRSVTYKREENITGTEKERLIANMYFMNLLESKGIKTQIKSNKIETIDGVEGIRVKKVKTIPIEFICRYYAAGSIVRLYPSLVKEGQKFKVPLYKFDLKQDVKVAGVDDPTLNENYIVGLEILSEEQLKVAKEILAKVGEIIREELASKGMKLIDMKMELGFDENDNIIVIDEISQDCIRANDIKTNESLTKDAFRKFKSDEEVLKCYREFNQRLQSKTFKRYQIYEFIRDNEKITEKMSNTKSLINKLMKNDKETVEYCNQKLLEEWEEVEEAKLGKHFHENMSKREILVNEISQYLYWLTVISVSKGHSFGVIEQKAKEILNDENVINEKITLEEVIEHDLEEMKTKSYLEEVI